MTAAPRFSVLLPTHNRADVLGFAIASVLAQSERDFELLVVADGCTDHTRDVVAGFADPRIRFFDLPKGPHFGYANRNVALREARGRFIAFAAHDDLLLPDHLASMGDLLERDGAAWGYSRPVWVSTDGIIVPFCTNLTLGDELRQFLEQRNTIPAACVVHTRSVLEQAGFWPENMPAAADWVLWRRMIACGGGRAAYLREPTNLHFSADWKRSRFAGIEEMRTLLDIADKAGWWPPILRYTPAAEPEQAALWRAMQAGGGAWIAAMRAAVDTVIERVAWNAVCEIQPNLQDALAARTRLQAEVDAAQAEIVSLRYRHVHMEAVAGAARADVAAVRAEAANARAEADMARAEAHALRDRQPAIDAALTACAVAEAATEHARAEIQTLRASTSWRITAPLRRIRTAFG